MAQYNITLSDGVTVVPIPDGSVNLTAADIPLVGQNSQLYGDDIARAQLFMLENFANTAAPAINTLTGQLWYDTTNKAINVYDGTSWDPMAPLAVGAADNSLARWDATAESWLEETQLTMTSAGTLSILDGTLADSVAFSHDGIDFNIVGTGTTDINVTGVTAVNLPSLTLVTALAAIEGGTGTDTYATGDVLFASGINTLAKLTAGATGDVLTLAAGVPSWVAGGAGVSAFNDLSDVNLAGAADNDLLFRSVGNWIDTAGAATWNGTNLSATQIGGIVEANLIDRSAPGTISGIATFTNNLVMSTGNITLVDNDSVIFGTGSDVNFNFDGIDMNIAAGVVTDLNVTGLSGAMKVNVAGHFGFAGSTGAGVRIIGDGNTDALNQGYVSVYHNNQGQEQVRMGTGVGNAFSEVRALTADLNLYASNNLVFNLNVTESIATQGGTETMRWHAVTGSNITTTASVNDNGGTARNIGFNETPETLVSVSRPITANDIGKYLRRDQSISRALTLDNVAAIPVGGSFLANNDHITGTLTIVQGVGVTLEWVDGSGTAPSTGTRTIAYNGIVTIRKKSSTVWQIWGNGIS